MANILGPLIGAAIDRRDGDSGVKGALLGSVLQSVGKTAIAAGLVIGAGWVVKALFDRSRDADREDHNIFNPHEAPAE